MWYVSGNRDDTAIENPRRSSSTGARPRHHVSFGFGIHRCVGMRLAEMQLKIVWEEILKRFPTIEIVEEPVRPEVLLPSGLPQADGQHPGGGLSRGARAAGRCKLRRLSSAGRHPKRRAPGAVASSQSHAKRNAGADAARPRFDPAQCFAPLAAQSCDRSARV
jgi:hypothetical protein